MATLGWLDIDGIRYAWHDGAVHCQTGVGYATQIAGHRLDGVELLDGNGQVMAQLHADFQQGTLQIQSLVSPAELAASGLQIGVGDEQGGRWVPVAQLPEVGISQSFLDDSTGLDTDVASVNHPTGQMVESALAPALAPEGLLSHDNASLDAYFGVSPVDHELPVTSEPVLVVDNSAEHLYLTYGVEPLQMPLLPEPQDVTSLF